MRYAIFRLLLCAVATAATTWRTSAQDQYFDPTGQDFKLTAVRYSGPTAVNIVLMGDGYTATEQEKFESDAKSLFDYMFSIAPFNRYADFFNLYTIRVVSKASGMGLASDTYFGAFAWGGSRQLKFSLNRSLRLLQHLVPGYNDNQGQTIGGVLVNSGYYAGSGGMVLGVTLNSWSHEMFVHEFGHTFANLADEYYYGEQAQASNASEQHANLTQETDPAKVKWKEWMGVDGVGIFHNLTSPYSHNQGAWYKPHRNCKMQYNGGRFCPVCREALVETIHKKVNPIVSYEPADTIVRLDTGGTQVFALTKLLKATGGTTAIRWVLDGDTLARDTESLTLDATLAEAGQDKRLTVLVEDVSDFVRTPQHAAHKRAVTWRIEARTEQHELPAEAADVSKLQDPTRSKADAPQRYYNVYGRELTRPQRGINIVRTPDGRKLKILTKH